MISYKEEYENLLALRKQLKTENFFQQYKTLALKKDRTLEEEELLLQLKQSKEMKNLFLIQRNIKQIECPIGSFPIQKINYVMGSGVNPLTLTLSHDYFFPDGSSVYLWFSSLLDFYKHDKIDEAISTALLRLYKESINYASFAGRIKYLQFLLKLSKDEFCLFLGTMPYLYPKLRNLTCNKKIIEGIIANLQSKDISNYNSYQQEEILSFLSLLKEEKKDCIPLKKGEQNSNALDNKLENSAMRVFQKHLEEALLYIETHSCFVIPKSLHFQDGINALNWMQNLAKRAYCGVDDLALDEKNKQSVYKIALALYNDKTLPLYENVPLNYGASLKRVILVFNLNKNSLFSSLSIPYSILTDILENKVFPNTRFIEKILSFLENLSCETVYQKEFVEDAIDIYTSLRKYPNSEVTYTYTIYPASLEEKYLESITEVDKLFLKKVKGQNCDWYMKCITLLFVLKMEKRIPTTDEYFYDGSLVFKWILTQKKTLFMKKASEEQKKLVSIIKTHYAYLSTRLTLFLTCHCDAVLDAFQEKISSNGCIRKGDLYQNQSLYNLWREFKTLIKKENCPFKPEEIIRYKELRFQIIYNEKMNGVGRYKENDSFAFGYVLACLADSLDIPGEVLGDFLSVNKSTFLAYLGNKVLPRLEHLENILSSVDKLPFLLKERGSLREDQVKDIENFKLYLQNLIAYRKIETKEYASFYRKIWEENKLTFSLEETQECIPSSLLEQIQKEDSVWTTSFWQFYTIVKNRKIFTPLQKITNFSWFKVESFHAMKGERTLLKQILLSYLYYFDQKNFYDNRVLSFMQNFLILENFIYEKERLPYKDEIRVADGRDGNVFYYALCSLYFTRRDFDRYFSEEQWEQMKNLLQYTTYLQRKSKSYKSDYQEGNKLYIGQRIDFLRICLKMYKGTFMKRLGFTYSTYEGLLYNRKALSSLQREQFLHFFDEIKDTLCEYQIREVAEIQDIILNGSLKEEFSFRFSKKEID